MLQPNTVLQNRYRIVRQLGKGGMGAVYEAVDQRLSSVVAIKETLVTTPDARQAFEREASLLANLRHRALPGVTDHFAEEAGQFLVMQFIPGEDLAQLLDSRQRPFPVEQVLSWADEILKALEYLHGHNPPVLHRDIKPANLKLAREGDLFLIDFGLSKGAAGQMPTLVTSRSVKGYTPAYAPLEQIHGGGTDPRSDLYSVGATLYHLLTNVVPADAPTRFNALDDLKADPMLPADTINPEVPKKLADVLVRVMAMNRRNRPESAAVMRQMLREAAPPAAETVVTIPKEPEPPLQPAQPASQTVPLEPTRPTDSELNEPVEKPVPSEPTIKEIPNLIQRPAPVYVQPMPPTPSGAIAQTPDRRRKKIVMAAIAGIVVLILVGAGAMLVVPRLSRRLANQSQATPTPGPGPSQAATPTPAEVSNKKNFTGEFNVGKALELVYGSYDYQKKYAKWRLTEEDLKNGGIDKESTGIRPGTVYTAANLVQAFNQSGVQRYFIITETVPAQYDCHACGPLVGGAVFTQQGDRWQLDSESRLVRPMGGFGTAPKGKLTKIGPDRYGVVFHDGGTGQGYTHEAVSLLAEVGERISEVLSVNPYGGDNEGTCGEDLQPCWKFSSRMDFESGSNPDYFDIKVTTTGTKTDDNGNIGRANAVKKYTFVNGKYTTAR